MTTSDPARDHRPANRLATQTSPYLLQHAHNPVDWYPWSEEALARARESDRPIFLSIGYAACHWCHVMERESFEDPEIAAYLNEHFVSIKVDREERPDLDAIYMDAVQTMTGQGGWPMSVFLTPDGEPFYGGTYFPDRPRHGMPAFRQILEALAHAWEHRRADVLQAGRQLAHALNAEARETAGAEAGLPPATTFGAAVAALERTFDRVHGGFGGAPKFPPSMTLEFLLQEYARSADASALAMARRTLDAMADGGIHDHLGGGFARYATDEVWLVPHFEKMLYDNALLARVYLHAWQVTGSPRYRAVAEDTLGYVAREMRVPQGGFTSSQDADTEGEEGATYVWTLAEVREVLGEDAPLFTSAYDVTERGNWEGSTILRRVRDDRDLAAMYGLDEQEVEPRLADARRRLFERRRTRPQPGRDDKVIASWNGLMLAAYAEAARVLGRDDLRAIAVEAGAFLLEALTGDDGRLRRSWKDGRTGPLGVLEDHTHLAEGLLSLYEATFDERWFVAARQLMDAVLERFSDPRGGWFDTAHDAERLVARPKGVQDNATPSGNAVAATVLLRLAAYTGEGRYREAAERAIALVAPVLARYPNAFAQWLSALELAQAPMDEIAVVGDVESRETQALVAVAFERFRPAQVVAAGPPAASTAVPLLADRPLRDDRPTAYVCHGFACLQPVTDPDALRRQLRDGAASASP